jgi:spermidine/putrescine transport system substrate-binding protein
MKRLIFLCAAVMFIFAGCGATGSGKSINVFNWGDFIDEDVLAMFTKETGIRIVYDTYATNEDMYTKIKSGGSEYDVLFPSDYMIERMINEDMLEKLDFGNIPNREYTDARFRNLPYDPREEYSVPYMWGTVGILYNTAMVREPVDSWDILWNENYANNIFMYSSLRDTIGIALIREGFSLNSTNIDELNAAKVSLIQQKPLVRAYLDDAVKHSMIGGEGALALVYSGDAIFCIEENADLDYAVPNEGSNVFYDAMVIPKGAKNKAEAEAFINFLCRPDIALMNTLYIGYSTTNAGAFAMLDDEIKNNPHYWTPDEIYYNCEAFRDLGDFLAEYNRAWTEILASR